MSKTRVGSLLVVFGGAVSALAILLPWGTFSGPTVEGGSQTVSGFNTGIDFVITAVLAVALAGLGLWMYLGHVTRGRAVAAALVGVLAAAWAAILFSVVRNAAGDLAASFSFGFGLVMVLVGAAIAVVGGLLALMVPAKPALTPVATRA